ncbi:MAG TPA: hypothetical protein VE244_15590 [Nitrososphaeraceae archaeon]|nr:hypothetical protein [Nitrososphaeraceae archaeon]
MIPRLFSIPYSVECVRKVFHTMRNKWGGMRANFRGVCEKVCEISNNITTYCVEKRV